MRVLILTSSTGGGHDMRADAFQDWAHHLREFDFQTQIYRPLDSGPLLYRFGVHLYNWIQGHAPFLHHIYFNFLELVRPVGSSNRLVGAQKFREALEKIRPHVLFSVHGSLNHGFFEVARRTLGDRPRCITYCGELHGGYGFSRNWVNPEADLFIGAVPETCDAAIALGMPREKTKLGGFLLRPQFYEDPPNESKFEPEKFILLLSASSRGANNHIDFLNALRRARIDVQIIVLCGKSRSARETVSRWIEANSEMDVRVFPSDTNMAILLRSVSAVVVRPGTGATSEAITSRCPLLLNCLGGIMPQEWITVKFCRKHGLAETVHRPKDLVEIVTRWSKDQREREAIRERMDRACPRATPREILSMVAQA